MSLKYKHATAALKPFVAINSSSLSLVCRASVNKDVYILVNITITGTIFSTQIPPKKKKTRIPV